MMPLPAITVHFPEEIWPGLLGSWLGFGWDALSEDLRTALAGALLSRAHAPDSTDRHALSLTRVQALELSQFLAGRCQKLGRDDRRRDICEQSLSDLEATVRQ
jgi:hypothetical protein